MDLLAGDFGPFVDDQKSEMGVAGDDGFCACADVFDIDDFRRDYSLD